MAPPSIYTFQTARTPEELAEIHRLNYKIFAEEIRQHEPDGTGLLKDRFDETNTYFTARRNNCLVGMICVNSQPPFSVAARLQDASVLQNLGPALLEVRLFAIEPAERNRRVLAGLLDAVLAHSRKGGHTHLIISGVREQLPMYRRLGFRALGPAVAAGAREFTPMALPVNEIPDQTLTRVCRSAARSRPISPRSAPNSKNAPFPLPVQWGMQYQQLGNTGVFVSRLCLGAMTFGGSEGLFQVIGGLDQTAVDSLVNKSLEAGINFFDTANVYSLGQSETMLGKALGPRRKEMVIASKAFGRMGKGPNDVGLSRLHIMQAVEGSLQRMGTDYIDLYQIHGFDPVTPFEETLSALTDLVRQGKVRYIGCSNLAAWQIVKALGISALLHFEKFVSLQAYYSLAGRDLEREIVPMLLDQKLGLMVWSPLAGGLLSGKFTRDGANTEGRRSKFTFPPVDLEKGYNVIDAMRTVAGRHDATVAQVALSWLLHQPVVTTVIIGAKNDAQLNDNLGAVNLTLTAEDLEQLNSVSALTPEYPGWMFGFQGSDRRPGTQRDMSNYVSGEK